MTIGTTAAHGIAGELIARVDALERGCDLLTANALADELENVRRIAARHGIGPAVTVIHALDSALARGEHGALVHGWLAILRDALGSGSADPRACETYAAACAVRLNG